MRTESLRPTKDDNFLAAICAALDLTPRQLAKKIGVDYREVEPLLKGTPGENVELDRDEVFIKLNAYLTDRMGLLMAARFTFDKVLQKQRTQRLMNMERIDRL